MTNSVLLVAIDPGVSSGVAFRFPDGSYRTCTVTDPHELWDFIKDCGPARVVFETFFTGGRVDANMLHTIELVGSLRGVCYVLGIPCDGQQPQARRSFLAEAKIRLQGILGVTPHERDALAHLLLLEWRISHGKV